MSNMEKNLFNLKFAAKELQRSSKKCDKEEKAEKAKVKKVNIRTNVCTCVFRLDLNMELPQGQTGSVGTSVASAEQDDLSQRLAKLRDQV
ncbi:charged multivesicular body protein 1b-1-like [Sinocyclocheilus grahami]|uniref:charged multivesicular body protein 1b-1-like n=1 Tax=Sinocyclocheilus grahami TaxID=75366 RepID=UPI0007ACCBF1|nr:PREDICTED: charged multivesicular body protein 1b-1-like [Sinocyclocheilus grahami]